MGGKKSCNGLVGICADRLKRSLAPYSLSLRLRRQRAPSLTGALPTGRGSVYGAVSEVPELCDRARVMRSHETFLTCSALEWVGPSRPGHSTLSTLRAQGRSFSDSHRWRR